MLGTAVDGYVEATGIQWADWEERLPGAVDQVRPAE
jgi:hypothetical protein